MLTNPELQHTLKLSLNCVKASWVSTQFSPSGLQRSCNTLSTQFCHSWSALKLRWNCDGESRVSTHYPRVVNAVSTRYYHSFNTLLKLPPSSASDFVKNVKTTCREETVNTFYSRVTERVPATKAYLYRHGQTDTPLLHGHVGPSTELQYFYTVFRWLQWSCRTVTFTAL